MVAVLHPVSKKPGIAIDTAPRVHKRVVVCRCCGSESKPDDTTKLQSLSPEGSGRSSMYWSVSDLPADSCMDMMMSPSSNRRPEAGANGMIFRAPGVASCAVANTVWKCTGAPPTCAGPAATTSNNCGGVTGASASMSSNSISHCSSSPVSATMRGMGVGPSREDVARAVLVPPPTAPPLLKVPAKESTSI